MECFKNFLENVFLWRSLEKFLWRPWRSPEKFLWRPFFFWRALALVFLVLGLGLEHFCPWPRECLSSERLSLALASDFFLCPWPRALCPQLHLWLLLVSLLDVQHWKGQCEAPIVCAGGSSVRRIFERGGGQKIQKISEECRPEWNFSSPKPSSFFCPKLGEDQKKKSSLKFSPVFGPKLHEGQKKIFAHRFCAQTLCPSYKKGGGNAAILHTILC